MEYRCIRCDRTPEQISEYIVAAKESGTDPSRFVAAEEGTFNPENGHFACTSCYIKMDMPTAPGGWRAP